MIDDFNDSFDSSYSRFKMGNAKETNLKFTSIRTVTVPVVVDNDTVLVVPGVMTPESY